jgi:ABC-type transporter Mla MlaB component
MKELSLVRVLNELSEIELQIIANSLRKLLKQYRFPSWVADTWVDDNKKRAVPLKNGTWLRTYYIDKPNSRIEKKMGDAIWYTGEIVNQDGKVVGGIETVNVNDREEIDASTWDDLIKFTREYKRRENEMLNDTNLIDNNTRELQALKKSGEKSLGRLAKDASNLY